MRSKAVAITGAIVLRKPWVSCMGIRGKPSVTAPL